MAEDKQTTPQADTLRNDPGSYGVVTGNLPIVIFFYAVWLLSAFLLFWLIYFKIVWYFIGLSCLCGVMLIAFSELIHYAKEKPSSKFREQILLERFQELVRLSSIKSKTEASFVEYLEAKMVIMMTEVNRPRSGEGS